jgi:hypothetical protein
MLLIFGLERIQTLRGRAASYVWSNPIDLSQGYGMEPQIAFDTKNNVLHAVWVAGDGLLRHSYSSDGGTTWSSPEKFGNTAGSHAEWLSLVVDSEGNAHVAYRKYADGPWYAKWTKATGLWSKPESISPNNGHSRMTITSDDTLHLTVFYGGSVFYRFKPKGGQWSKVETITNDGSWSAIASSGSDVGLVWKVDSSKSLVFQKKTAGGWGPTQTIAKSIGGDGLPKITYGNGQFQVIWKDNFTLKYANESNWRNSTTIAGDNTPVDIAVDNFNTVHVIWDNSSNDKIDYAFFDSSANQWVVTPDVFSVVVRAAPVGTLRYWNGNLYAVYSANNATDQHVYFTVKSTSGIPLSSPTPTPSPTTPAGNSPSPTVSSTATATPTSSSSSSPTPDTGNCPASEKAACWDCNHDQVVNILDFACFIKYYNQSY